MNLFDGYPIEEIGFKSVFIFMNLFVLNYVTLLE